PVTAQPRQANTPATKTAAGWPRQPKSAATETRNHGGVPSHLCTHSGLGTPPSFRLQRRLAERGHSSAVSAVPRCLGWLLGHQPWSRTPAEAPATTNDFPNARFGLEATNGDRVEQRDVQNSGPDAPSVRGRRARQGDLPNS